MAMTAPSIGYPRLKRLSRSNQRPWNAPGCLWRDASERPECGWATFFERWRWRTFLETLGALLQARPEVPAPLPPVLQPGPLVRQPHETCRRGRPLRQQTEIAASGCRAHDAQCLWRARGPAAGPVEADRLSPRESALLSSSRATEVLLVALRLPSPSAAPADSGLLRLAIGSRVREARQPRSRLQQPPP